MSERRSGGSYDYVTLRIGNIKYVSDITGKSMNELKKLLDASVTKGKNSVKLPLGVDYFTRDD